MQESDINLKDPINIGIYFLNYNLYIFQARRMFGANAAVAVRNERRKHKTKDKENRPKHLLLKAHVNKTLGDNLSPNGSHAPSANPSRAGSPTHQADLPELVYEVRYGDDCFDGKLSLLHFIVFFFLGGLTVLIVGAVQVGTIFHFLCELSVC